MEKRPRTALRGVELQDVCSNITITPHAITSRTRRSAVRGRFLHFLCPLSTLNS